MSVVSFPRFPLASTSSHKPFSRQAEPVQSAPRFGGLSRPQQEKTDAWTLEASPLPKATRETRLPEWVAESLEASISKALYLQDTQGDKAVRFPVMLVQKKANSGEKRQALRTMAGFFEGMTQKRAVVMTLPSPSVGGFYPSLTYAEALAETAKALREDQGLQPDEHLILAFSPQYPHLTGYAALVTNVSRQGLLPPNTHVVLTATEPALDALKQERVADAILRRVNVIDIN